MSTLLVMALLALLAADIDKYRFKLFTQYVPCPTISLDSDVRNCMRSYRSYRKGSVLRPHTGQHPKTRSVSAVSDVSDSTNWIRPDNLGFACRM